MSNFIYGPDRKCLAKAESTYGTASAFVAGDSVPLVDLKFTPDDPYHASIEALGTGSLVNETKGRESGKFSLKSLIRPRSAGTAPDCGDILKAAYGTETVSGGTSVTYSLSDVLSLQLAEDAVNGYQVANGCGVEEVVYEIAEGADCTISVNGFYSRLGWARRAVTDGSSYASSVSLVNLVAASVGRLGVNGRVSFTGDDNSGAGYLVTAVSGAAVTISPALATGISASAVVSPISPFALSSCGGTIIAGVDCGLSVGGTAIGFKTAKLTYKTGYSPRTESNAARATGVLRGRRSVVLEATCYLVDDDASGSQSVYAPSNLAGKAWDGTTYAIILRAGANTAGQRLKLNMPAARIAVTPIETPESEATMFALKAIAHLSSASNDEHTAVFD